VVGPSDPVPNGENHGDGVWVALTVANSAHFTPQQIQVLKKASLCGASAVLISVDTPYRSFEWRMALDHYASLGVTRTSESVVIRAAYLALMRQYHPDANIAPQADARVREINAAYDVLGNAEKRREYDRGLDWGAPTRATNFGHRPPGVGPMAFGITILTVSALVWGIWAQQGPRDVSAAAAAATTSGAIGTRPFGEETCLPAMADEIVRRDLLHYANSVRGLPGLDLPELADKLMIQTTAAPSLVDSTPEAVACKLTMTVKAPSGFTFRDGMRAVVGTAH
jgi:hypothetical protein